MALKGVVGQVEHDDTNTFANPNPNIGFKSCQYSVTESSGNVEITIIKKIDEELTFTYRTVDDSAKDPKDYLSKEETLTMKAD
jgi:hypothetical protein